VIHNPGSRVATQERQNKADGTGKSFANYAYDNGLKEALAAGIPRDLRPYYALGLLEAELTLRMYALEAYLEDALIPGWIRLGLERDIIHMKSALAKARAALENGSEDGKTGTT
jgi:hypothetical protein